MAVKCVRPLSYGMQLRPMVCPGPLMGWVDSSAAYHAEQVQTAPVDMGSEIVRCIGDVWWCVSMPISDVRCAHSQYSVEWFEIYRLFSGDVRGINVSVRHSFGDVR